MLLLPLTMWYALGVALRNLFFDLGWKKSVKPDVPTIGIGNLRMGGTGKTPHTEYIIRLLEGRRAALLSRGYGRETKGFVLADSHSTAGLGLRRDYGWITDGLPLVYGLIVYGCQHTLFC